MSRLSAEQLATYKRDAKRYDLIDASDVQLMLAEIDALRAERDAAVKALEVAKGALRFAYASSDPNFCEKALSEIAKMGETR